MTVLKRVGILTAINCEVDNGVLNDNRFGDGEQMFVDGVDVQQRWPPHTDLIVLVGYPYRPRDLVKLIINMTLTIVPGKKIMGKLENERM